ncbi:PhzF family phenazine biosynthesis protein [Desulfosarcina sp.]|uniref:PhzF family phenazine biosynthesis protein n=1 Tax=Desulfosarcina sp. TaxID=2027861 RepID=UPI003970FCC7
MEIKVPIVNAFVDGNVGGNPAGVVLDAQQFSHDQKRCIAAGVGLSETAFVSPSSIADYKLEFFTPTRQIAHCGHATIATFSYMKQLGMLNSDQTSKETVDGRREILMEGEYAFMEQLAPRYTYLSQADHLRAMAAIGLKASDILEGVQPSIVNTGNSFLVIALRNQADVKSIVPIKAQIATVSEIYDLIGFYIFSPQTTKGGRDAGARMFAPRYGIDEESATGMAAGPLACYLHDKLNVKKNSFAIEQGYLMPQPSPSVISVRLHKEDGSISSLMAGGMAAVSEIRKVDC